eukprot:GGOE01041112.1.p1 GENE.GGOE01041112.1~~GGOE01041112.1.p1  ORF type:complete len:511 (+),score=179.61 GGOE01041112.1:53-1534(+)
MSEEVGAPSRVAFLRSLPPGASEQEVLALGIPFGTVTRLLLLQTKSLAFIEFDSVAAASALVAHHQTSPATLRGHRFHVKFSDKAELTSGTVPSSLLATADKPQDGLQEEANGRRVLLTTLDGLRQAISIDDVFNVFNCYGTVEKISTFIKANKNLVLIQFDGPQSAAAAMSNLNNRNVGVCTLQIRWSTLPELTFQRNDDRNRDYTAFTPALPTISPIGSSGLVTTPIHVSGPTPVGPVGPIHINPVGPIRVGPVGMGVGLSAIGTPSIGLPSISMGAGIPIMTAQNGLPVSIGAATPAVLFVSNLDETMATATVLFTLFGLYGTVELVKVLFKKRDSALVQFADRQCANQARVFLHGLDLYGKPMHITNSKNVSITAGAAEEAHLMASPATQRPSIYTGKTVVPPSSTLHISNIHPEVTEEQLTNLFSQYGALEAFEFFKTTTKMAKAQFGSIGAATAALLSLSFYTLQLPSGKACTLHLAFSKHPIHASP